MKAIDQAISSLLADFNDYLYVGSRKAYYGRVFRKDENGGIIPEVWVNGNNYLTIVKDTSKDVQLFFDVQPSIQSIADVNTADVWLCCMLNLSTLYPLLDRNEATQTAQRDIKFHILNSEFSINGMVTGAEGFKAYNMDATLQDLAPHYLLRFNLSLVYINN
jgi:hypothetical protein